jgi:hypothetical protein
MEYSHAKMRSWAHNIKGNSKNFGLDSPATGQDTTAPVSNDG